MFRNQTQQLEWANTILVNLAKGSSKKSLFTIAEHTNERDKEKRHGKPFILVSMERGSGNLAANGTEIRHVWNAIQSTCACAKS